MRNRYHIKIDGKDKARFEEIIAELSPLVYWAGTTTFEDGKVVTDYVVDLSKYELLLLRLSVKTGEILNTL